MTGEGPVPGALPDDLRRRLERLSPAQRALLEQRLGLAPEAHAGERIPRREADGPAPLSFNQELLWRLDRAVPDLVAYNVPRVLRIRGALDVEALRRALDGVVARHEALRTRFVDDGAGPAQVVDPPRAVPLEVIELSGEADAEAAAERLVERLTRRRFDLERDLQLRATLLRLGAGDHVLHLLSHHIVTDEGSRDALFRDLGALYAAFRRDVPAALPELPIQYADFAAWQRREMDTPAMAERLAWWQERLRGVPALELPADRPRSAAVGFAGGRVRRRMPRELAERLRRVGREHGATPFMTLLAAFQLLLARYTGQTDIAVATPVTARRRPELEGLVGFFANTLVLRTELGGDPTFVELLSRVRETCVAAFERDDVPYERLVLALRGAGGGGGAPADVSFVMDTPGTAGLELEGATVEAVPVDAGSAKLDLTLAVADEPDGLRATVEYRSELFERATIERMLGHLETLLEGIAAAPERRISALPLLAAAERAQVLEAWNATTTERPGGTLVELLAEQAARTPDAVAVEAEDAAGGRTRLTYAELDRRSNRLAWELRRLGVGADVPVALFLERSPELIVATLGVLKAGGAYLPLDPEFPAERTAFMLGDAVPGVVVTVERLRGRLPAHAAAVVSLDGAEDAARLAAHPAERAPAAETEGDDVAYILYTSGSTGRPKGVMVPHRAIASFTRWVRTLRPLGPGDTVFQKTAITFDPSGLECYLALTTGARLLLARPDERQDLTYVLETMRRERVTAVVFIPSVLAASADLPEFAAACRALRLIICGGEALSAELAVRALACAPEAELYNLYGPTEATIAATAWRVRRAEPAVGMLPIGRPVDDTRAYVLDRRREPVPVGVAGELWLAGEQVARGYLNRPELTAEHFVEDPFAAGPGRRMYRTGDRARWRADGVLEFLGRRDEQVKLRGFRIELGEVEAALVRHPAVRAAVAVVREDRPGDRRLVAYYAAAPEAAGVDAELLAGLRSALPPYMLPGALVRLDALPLTGNGKVDRDALPSAGEAAARPYVAPRTELEAVVAEAWAEVLGVERVGAEDGFLELGGHSLLAMRVVGRLRQRLGVTAPIAELLRGASVAELAAALEAAGRGASTAEEGDEPLLAPVDRSAYRRSVAAAPGAGGGA
ncbi:MAG TPA: amino acid adenylation domain-containing protein [Longimicrobiales bacterium]|nr:amino acid adenylation domain-containing protein [Longimicrobiales bacterium]